MFLPSPGRPRPRFALAFIFASLLVAFLGCSGGGGGGGYGGGPPTGPGKFNLGPFGLSQSIVQDFPTAGTFGYHCIPHQGSGMTGTVLVDMMGADSDFVQIGVGNALTFTPNSSHIKPGGHVRWQNVSNMTIHTATQN